MASATISAIRPAPEAARRARSAPPHLRYPDPDGAPRRLRAPRDVPAATAAPRAASTTMQVAVFSDIHANLPAFEAVLRDSDEVGVEERWCLGDVIGYGAQPDGCVELARERCEVCLVGNHDLAVLGELDTSTFSSAAAAAVEWTAENTSKPNLDYLAGLSPPTPPGPPRSTTPPRAIPSGSTCSGRSRPPTASRSRTSGSASSATRTSPCSSRRPPRTASARPAAGRRAPEPASRSTRAGG